MKIKLTNCNRFALIDAEDAIRAIRHNWYLLKVGYVGTHMTINGKKMIVYLHRFVMKANAGDPASFVHGETLVLNRFNSAYDFS